MTKNEQKVLSFIKNHIKKKAYSPSFREIQKAFDLSSVGSVQSYIKQLQEKGHLQKTAFKKRTLKLTQKPNTLSESVKLPLLGEVAAGAPLESHTYNEFVDVPLNLVPHGDKDCFVLRVSGDSMKNAGILDKDLIIVKSCSWADNGCIVVATTVDESSTLKRVFHHENKVELRPENENFSSQFYSLNEISIKGKLMGLIRNY